MTDPHPTHPTDVWARGKGRRCVYVRVRDDSWFIYVKLVNSFTAEKGDETAMFR